MRALRLHAPGDLRMSDEPIPVPSQGEALVKVCSVGICASDVHWWRDGHIGNTYLSEPLVLGHEASGIVEAIGEGVTGLTVGQRVAIEPAKPCMTCEFCLSGHFNVCPNVKFFGTPPTDGCFRDYITWPATLLIPIPDSISMDEAAMLEPLAVGVFAVELAEVTAGKTAVILGAGAIGLSVLQSLIAAGAKPILVSDPVPERREMAKKLGADAVCDPVNIHSEAELITSRSGFDFTFECAGDMLAVKEASKLAKILGKVLVVGIPREDEYPFDAGAARRKQLTAIFVRRSNLTTERAVELVEKEQINVLDYVTHIFPLEKAGDALKLAESKADSILRAVVRVTEES